MPQNLPFLAPITGEGFQARPTRIPQRAPAVDGLIGAATGSQPWRSREELYKSAYSKPIKTQGFAQGSPGEFEEFSYDPVGEPNRRAAMDELTQLLQTERGNDSFERERIQGIRGQQDEALTQGFDRPQDQALYARRIAEEKMRQPVEIQNSQNTQESLNTMMSGQNAMNVARLQDEGYTQRAKSAEDFQKWLMQNNPTNTPVSGYTAPGRYGGGGTRFDTNPQAVAQVPAATKKLAADTWFNYNQNPSPENESAYFIAAGQALESAMASGSMSPSTVDVVGQIMRDRNLRNLSFEELLPHLSTSDENSPGGEFDVDPNNPQDAQELQEIRRALLLIKGL